MAGMQESLLQQIKDQGDLVRKLKAAKESSEKATKSNTSSMDLKTMDRHFSKFSYASGYMPSKYDIDMMKSLGLKVNFKQYPYLKRWWHHMRSFSDSEISLLSSTIETDVHSNIMKCDDYEQKVCDTVVRVVLQ